MVSCRCLYTESGKQFLLFVNLREDRAVYETNTGL